VPTRARTAWIVLVAACVSTGAGCARARIENGRYFSPKGYRVAAPPDGWTVVGRSPADLAMRHDSPRAEMLVNGSCAGEGRGGSAEILARHVLMGVMQRRVIEKGEAAIGGRLAAHVVLEGRAPDGEVPVRVEAYVMKDERCIYDFLYAAPVASFETWRRDFQRLVESFTTE